MKKFLSVMSVITSLALIAGCDSKPDASRYPSIQVPGYTNNDYVMFLADKNPEIVYNAVCNLLESASSMGSLLADKKADKASDGYVTALKVYYEVPKLLVSSDTRILAATLRFVQLFAGAYDDADKAKEVTALVAKVGNNNDNVQFEKEAALAVLAAQYPNMDSSVVKGFMASRSWLVSRGCYALVNALKSDSLRMELIKKYKASKDEMDKLLILTAMQDDFSDGVLEFLTGELLNSKNARIKTAILGMLGGAKDQNSVLVWLENNYGKLSADEISTLAENNYDTSNSFSTSITEVLIKNGFVPDDKSLKLTAKNIAGYQRMKELSEDQKKNVENITRLDNALAASPIKDKWHSMKLGAAKLYEDLLSVKDEYDKAADRFTAEVGGILAKHNMNEAQKEEFIKNLGVKNKDIMDALWPEEKEETEQ